MSTERNKEFVRQHFEEFVNQKKLEVADRNFSSDFIDHGNDTPADFRSGPDGPKRYLAGVFQRFPDIHVTINDIIAEGDRVVVRNTWKATESVTGRALEFSGVVIWRIANGQLAERWAYLEAVHPAS